MDLHTASYGLLGGGLIGLAAGALLALNGRIAGISGIYGGALERPRGDTLWRVLFIAGLLAGGAMLRLVYPESLPSGHLLGDSGQWALLILAGVLVGAGTRLAGGCTSGHGVCGLSRLSPRSMVATLIFMIVAMITVAVAGRLAGGWP